MELLIAAGVVAAAVIALVGVNSPEPTATKEETEAKAAEAAVEIARLDLHLAETTMVKAGHRVRQLQARTQRGNGKLTAYWMTQLADAQAELRAAEETRNRARGSLHTAILNYETAILNYEHAEHARRQAVA